MIEQDGYLIVEGTVLKLESGSRFQVEVKLEERPFLVSAVLSGHLKLHKIRIVLHDRVRLEILASDLLNNEQKINGRITGRIDQVVGMAKADEESDEALDEEIELDN